MKGFPREELARAGAERIADSAEQLIRFFL